MSWKRFLGLSDNQVEAVETPKIEEVESPAAAAAALEPPGIGDWWWLVEHAIKLKTKLRLTGGHAVPEFDEIPPTAEEVAKATPHPAFYLRTLMPGDFAPGRLPAPRHVRLLERGEGLPAEVTCGTCGEIPRSEDLDVVERQTGHRGFLSEFRSGRARWPNQTKAESCWMCSGQAPATTQARLRGTDVRVCAGCAKHLERRT